jgi:hypothetical protein
LVTLSAGVRALVTVAVTAGEVTAPPLLVPLAVAVLAMLPLSRSAWVVV